MNKKLFFTALLLIGIATGSEAVFVGGVRMGDPLNGSLFTAPVTPLVLTSGGSPVWDTTTMKFGTGALASGGYGQSSAFPPVGNPATIQLWNKCASPPVANSYLFATDNGAGARLQVVIFTGTGFVNFGFDSAGTQFSISNAANLCDGVWHNLEIDLTSTGMQAYIDGFALGFSAHVPSLDQGAFVAIGARARTFANISTVETDEVSVWNVQLHSANFTPPVAPWVGNEFGLRYLWHLDSNFTNSRPGT